MRIIKFDQRKAILKAIVINIDDILVLSYIIEKGDKLIAFSKRKLDINGEKVIKFVKIGVVVEDLKLNQSCLTISGKIFFSSDKDVPLHKYHNINLCLGDGFSLTKSRFLNFQIESIKNLQQKIPRIFICVYESGHAIFYYMTNYMIRKRYEFNENVSGKRFKNQSRSQFLQHLSELLTKELERKWDLFIVAGDNLSNNVLRELLNDKRVIYETVSYADTGLKELLSRGVVNEYLKKNQVSKQRELINYYIKKISESDQNFVYGLEKIKNALNGSNPEEAIVTLDFVLNNKELVSDLDKKGAYITVFVGDEESKSMLDNFGGIIVKLAQ